MKTKLSGSNIKSNYVLELMKERGIENPEYLLNISGQNADIEQLYTSCKLLENIDRAADLYKSWCESKKKMGIVVDSDTDGITSAALFYLATKELYPEVPLTYFMHSGKGHGLEDLMEEIEDSDCEVIILPDAGTNDFNYIEKLGEQGIKCLIIDHHDANIDFKKSQYCEIVNNQLSPNYNNKDLTGVGVVFQFFNFIMHEKVYKYADLAALGIISDMGSIAQPENKILIEYGLWNIQNPFIREALDKQSFSMEGKINYISVSFYITPLINAMIRVGTMEEKRRMFEAFIDGEKLIPSKKKGAAGALEQAAIESLRECTNAKSHQKKFQEKAAEQLEIKISNENLLDNKILFIVLDEDMDFPSELNGLIAMTLAAEHKKPTIIARPNSDNLVRGSIRGLNNSALSDFKQFLLDSNMFEYVSGHPNAAGMGISLNKVDEFNKYANFALKDYNFNEDVYVVDFMRRAAEEDIKDIIEDVDSASECWGTNNPVPLINIKDLYIDHNDIQVIGKNKNTLKFTKFGVTYIKFFAKDLIKELEQYKNSQIKLEVVGKCKVNVYYGRSTPQIQIESIEIKNGELEF